ncbi:MAG TPA: hypothetical protein VF281_03665 [Candidatus Saccharimonadales bacterium]
MPGNYDDELAGPRRARACDQWRQELNGIADDVVLTAVAGILGGLLVDPETRLINESVDSVTYAVEQKVIDISGLTRVNFVDRVTTWLWRVLECDGESLTLTSPDPNGYVILEYIPRHLANH